MEKIATLTPGQHIIFGMVLSYFSNHLNLVFPQENYVRLVNFIQEFDAPDMNNPYDLTPSEGMEEHIDKVSDIFVLIWEQYEEVFLELQKS